MADTYLYRWEGKDAHGATLTGELSASGHAQLRAQLRRKGITVRSIRRQRTSRRRAGRSVNASDITLFSRQLATLIQSGVPLLQALEVIGKGFEQCAMRQLMIELTRDIAAGTSLTAALRKKPEHFDTLFCNLVEAGEQAGALDRLSDPLPSHGRRLPPATRPHAQR